MNLSSGVFDKPQEHHKGWFRVFRFKSGYEVWLGRRWYMIGLK